VCVCVRYSVYFSFVSGKNEGDLSTPKPLVPYNSDDSDVVSDKDAPPSKLHTIVRNLTDTDTVSSTVPTNDDDDTRRGYENRKSEH